MILNGRVDLRDMRMYQTVKTEDSEVLTRCDIKMQNALFTPNGVSGCTNVSPRCTGGHVLHVNGAAHGIYMDYVMFINRGQKEGTYDAKYTFSRFSRIIII